MKKSYAKVKMVQARIRSLSESKEYQDKSTKQSYQAALLTDLEIHITRDGEVKKQWTGTLITETTVFPVVCEENEPCTGADQGKLKDVDDPWDIPSFRDESIPWNDLSGCERVQRVLVEWIGKALGLIALLYFFICSLDLLSSAFRLLGGKTAGSAFSSDSVLQNPVCGLMIGILATVLVQSSSTSTSIVITMVASGILSVEHAIYIIMGANIGTSVTNTIVSMAQSGDRNQFRRAFAGATVHDMFNWLSVAVLLPLEYCTGYLYRLTSLLVVKCGFEAGTGSKCDFLKRLTKPLTSNVIQLDKSVITGIALGKHEYLEKSLIKKWCKYESEVVEQNVTVVPSVNGTDTTLTPGEQVSDPTYILQNVTVKVPVQECSFLLHDTGMRDSVIGVLLLGVSLVLLCTCLIMMVKLLNSVLKGSIAKVVRRMVNAEFPGKFKYLTGYVAILLGAVMTVLVQSSSVFTSALTPLVGVGVIRLERMYPLTLGSNIGTTGTGLLAAMAASDSTQLRHSIQIALVHLFFNISGILLFYPIPHMRFPIGLAKMMGNTTAKYRWFAGLYLIVMFMLLPASIFALSMAGTVVFTVVLSVVMVILVCVVILNVLQSKVKSRLPKIIQTWDFLPFEWMHSLEPMDRLITKGFEILKPVFRPCSTLKSTSSEEGALREVVTDGSERGTEMESLNSANSSSLFDDQQGENDNDANNGDNIDCSQSLVELNPSPKSGSLFDENVENVDEGKSDEVSEKNKDKTYTIDNHNTQQEMSSECTSCLDSRRVECNSLRQIDKTNENTCVINQNVCDQRCHMTKDVSHCCDEMSCKHLDVAVVTGHSLPRKSCSVDISQECKTL